MRLQNLLELHQVSQTEVAKKLHVTPQAVSKWVIGTGCPRPKHAIKLETMLNVRVDLRTLASGKLRFIKGD